ncbi:MAG: hypothetical protein EOO50_10845 [Flavobacterium sp.]|uniref:hypothetical protein n=1 Tax=Flavobacterium sp. TaxID=239 RepID=UPI0011F4CCC3|nr:hypothetical protein [Flavobacterium sp.]RZJ66155.1 MAG: hypothetical protein EOO50_10845 [Flavobacterium sp.]
MKMPCQEYELQIRKARETIGLLEDKLQKVRQKLEKSPEDATFRRELKQITLDMTITMNELEHAKSEFENCK